eukprot:3491098-Rhodomonas_salina.1
MCIRDRENVEHRGRSLGLGHVGSGAAHVLDVVVDELLHVIAGHGDLGAVLAKLKRRPHLRGTANREPSPVKP